MPGDPSKPLQAPSDLGQPTGPVFRHVDANGQLVDDDPAQTAQRQADNGTPQPGQGGVASGVNYDPRTGMSSFAPGATTGQIQDPYAWGGTSGSVTVGPDGKPAIDTSTSGRAQDVTRLQGMGADMARRQAYQLNYGKGNVDKAQGQVDRGREVAAVGLLANAAKGGAPSAAVIGSQGGMDDAFGAQLAAQGGARNVAQAGAANNAGASAAMGGQLAATSGFGAQRSGELLGDRTAYAGAAGALRTGDYGQQSLDQGRAKAQYESEIAQRGLNDQGRRQAEDLAFGVNQKAMEGGQAETDRATGNYTTSLQRQTNQADRTASLYNGAMAQAGKMMPSGGGDPNDPNKDNG